MTVSDGLGMLDQQRARRARQIPASKNPPRSKSVSMPATAITQPAEQPVAEPKPIKRSENKLAAKPVAAEPTVKMSIYLEPADDLYLEEITHAGKTSRPRVAISRSAIVRLALERLGGTMTVDEIVRELRGRGEHHQGPGRKRR